jgi:glutamate-1-semialdehyde 2,1-aminomutase
MLSEEPNKYACVILDAAAVDAPKVNLLNVIREKCSKTGTLLIFDDVINAFRLHERGVMGCTNVIPDAICLGKTLANGLPLSALLVSNELSENLHHIGFTTTFGVENISLVAGSTVIDILNDGHITSQINRFGKQLMDHITSEISNYKLNSLVACRGYPGMIRLHCASEEICLGTTVGHKLMELLANNGVFFQDFIAISAAHKEVEIKKLEDAFSDAMRALARC